MRHRLLAGAVAVICAAGLAGAGCGVPLEDSPRVIDETSTTETTVATTEPGTTGQTMAVYYLRADRLTRVEVAADDTPSAAEAVAAVLQAPAEGFQTKIPEGTAVLAFSVDTNRVATIDLSEDINNVEAEGQKAAYAQLVFTALASGEANKVRFLVGGEPVSAATDSGNLDVITASDYDPSFRPTS